MNTPSHAILNLALLMNQQPQAALPIVIGAVLPDVPMFVMYFWAKKICHQSERQVWGETYWQPFWQVIIHSFHSIPLAAIACFLCHAAGWHLASLLFLSAILHCLGDFPLHNHDAHRHFFPFTNYRFISPISYWDPRRHGRLVGRVEKGLVLIATIYLFPILDSWIWQGLMVAVNVMYLTGYFYRWVFQGCLRTPAEQQSELV